MEQELERHTTLKERQGSAAILSGPRRRKVGKYFDRVEKQRAEVATRKQQLDDTPDYIPTPAETEHLRAEEELRRMSKEQAVAKEEERFATVLNLQPKIDALKRKIGTLGPIVRRTRATRINDWKFDLKSNPKDQLAGNFAQRLRMQAAQARQ